MFIVNQILRFLNSVGVTCQNFSDIVQGIFCTTQRVDQNISRNRFRSHFTRPKIICPTISPFFIGCCFWPVALGTFWKHIETLRPR